MLVRKLSIVFFSRWLKQEYEISFPLNKQPPVHMPITYGLVDIAKLSKRGTLQSSSKSQESSSSQTDGGTQSEDGIEVIDEGEITCTKTLECSLCCNSTEVGTASVN